MHEVLVGVVAISCRLMYINVDSGRGAAGAFNGGHFGRLLHRLRCQAKGKHGGGGGEGGGMKRNWLKKRVIKCE